MMSDTPILMWWIIYKEYWHLPIQTVATVIVTKTQTWMQFWMQSSWIWADNHVQLFLEISADWAIMNAVSQWRIGSPRIPKTSIAGSMPVGGSLDLGRTVIRYWSQTFARRTKRWKILNKVFSESCSLVRTTNHCEIFIFTPKQEKNGKCR